MHLPFDQGKSPADTVVGSREVVEAIQIVDFAGGGHLLTSHAPDTKTGDGEMVPLAIVIQSAFSGCCRTVVGSRPLLNPDSGRRRGTRGRSHRCASREEEDCDTRKGEIDEVGFHGWRGFWLVR